MTISLKSWTVYNNCTTSRDSWNRSMRCPKPAPSALALGEL